MPIFAVPCEIIYILKMEVEENVRRLPYQCLQIKMESGEDDEVVHLFMSSAVLPPQQEG